MSLAQTSLVLRNGEVEQKHSDESECLKITKENKYMEIVIEISDDVDRTEMHQLTTAIEFMIWNNGVKIVKSITEKVE